MPTPDLAKAVKTAVAGNWSSAHPSWTVTLQVDDDYRPADNTALLLVDDDGGPQIIRSPWLVRKVPRRTVLRMTGMANGRDLARLVVDTAADFVLAHKPGISRIEDVSDPLITRDRATGAFLASITMPVIVRPN